MAAQIPRRPTMPATGSRRGPCPHGPQPQPPPPQHRRPHKRPQSDAARRGGERGGPGEARIRGRPALGSRSGANRGALPHRRRLCCQGCGFQWCGHGPPRVGTSGTNGRFGGSSLRGLGSHAPPPPPLPTRGGLTLKLTSEYSGRRRRGFYAGLGRRGPLARVHCQSITAHGRAAVDLYFGPNLTSFLVHGAHTLDATPTEFGQQNMSIWFFYRIWIWREKKTLHVCLQQHHPIMPFRDESQSRCLQGWWTRAASTKHAAGTSVSLYSTVLPRPWPIIPHCHSQRQRQH